MRRSQLLAAGISKSTIDTMLANGRLCHRHQGVYAASPVLPGELTRETEALLACPDGAVLSHWAAAALWGLLAPSSSSQPIDVTIAGTRTLHRRGIRAHRTSTLDVRRDVRIRHGLPVTAPARTIVDIAGETSEPQLERALDDAIHRELVRLTQLKDAIARAGKTRKGIPILKALIADREEGHGLTRSDAELTLKRHLRAANLPHPDLNANFGQYRPDMVWWEERVIVEVDSWRWHGTRGSFEADRRRDAALTAQGWTILRFTARQIEQRPFEVIAQIAAALAHGAARAAARRAG